MKYLSVCSGIEAATVAWHPLGWTPVGFGEIEKFPCQVLAHHYPDVTNFGDMTKFKEWNFESDVNVLVGGTPCQSFSVAGLRKGLDDPRGNLMLGYLAIAAKHRPQWLVWENVPGVLSSNGGLDFASLLRGMGELGYGFAYRVLDAQYFGVAQRRRRVFVVGYLGNWRPAAAVLFERHSLQGHPAPSREKRQGVAASVASGAPVSRTGNDRVETDAMVVVGSLCARTGQSNSVQDAEQGHLQSIGVDIFNGAFTGDTAASLTKRADGTGTGPSVMQPIPLDMMNIRGRPSDDGRANRIGRGYGEVGDPMFTITKANHHAVAQPLPFDTTQITSPQNGNNPQAGDPCHPLAAGAHPPAICLMDQGGSVMTIENDITGTLRRETHGHEPVMMQPIAFRRNDDGRDATHNLAPTMRVAGNAGGMLGIATSMAVRRLTCMECERLQGFPDGYTDIQPKGKATPDGPRYKALGNSMAVPVMRWIGKRIQEVEGIA